MNDLIINILRGSVSSVMYVILLFTLTKSRVGRKRTIIVTSFVFFINITSTIWFYVYWTSHVYPVSTLLSPLSSNL